MRSTRQCPPRLLTMRADFSLRSYSPPFELRLPSVELRKIKRADQRRISASSYRACTGDGPEITPDSRVCQEIASLISFLELSNKCDNPGNKELGLRLAPREECLERLASRALI